MKTRTPLHDGWTLHVEDAPEGVVPSGVRNALPIPATVPGVVHTDLLAAGLIPDPYLDLNELDLQWIGRVDWRYELVFEAHPVDGDEADLAFDGLDTVALIELNGIELGRTENQHRRYRLRATAALREGSNHLVVRFASPERFGESERDHVGALPSQYPGPFPHMRKMACNFGWDWGPVLVTSGIWRPVALETWRGTRMAGVRPAVSVDSAGTGIVDARVALAEPAPSAVVLSASVGGHDARVEVPAGATEATVRVEVPHAELWWPRGMGGQPLSDLTIALGDLDTWSQRIGFRTVELDTSPDDDGSRWELRVNGRLLPVRGANWIPDDCFPSRVTRDRLRQRIEQGAGAGLNLLRIWGGGTYESDEFYELCDELGIAVWQDFLFACAAYPENERLAREVDAEARDNVERLMSHPSLVLWNGNNENIWGYFDWDWQQPIGDRDWGLGYYLGVLPAAVAEVDATRPYWPGSPYSGSMQIHPNDPRHGTVHRWNVWNEVDYAHYRDVRPRFVAEYGWQAPATWATIRRSLSGEIVPDSPGMLHHQRARDGQAKLTRGLAAHLPEPASTDDWLLATQVTQARAFTAGIEFFRSERPRCSGSILWQLNDCWPVTSWSLVDGDGRLKPAWYAVRAANAERMLTLQPTEGGLTLVAVCDSVEPWAADVRLRRIGFGGSVLAEQTARIATGADGVARIRLETTVATAGDPTAELIVAEAGYVRALWFFADDHHLRYDDGLDATAIRRSDGDVDLSLTATTLVRDLCVLADRIDPAAEAEQSMLTLLPGDTVSVRVTGIPEGREEELTRAPVLRSIGDVVRAAR